MSRISAVFALFVSLLAGPAFAQDMPLSQVLFDWENWELVSAGYQFTEGPAVDANGVLYFTDIPASKIFKLEPTGTVSKFVEDSGKANGLMFGPAGRLYACQNGEKKIVAFDTEGKPTTIASDVESNDLVVRGDGSIYFTDPKNQKVWYISPGGEKRVVDEGITFPNGLILWPDQGTLVVADMKSDRLFAFRIEKDGSLTSKQPYYMLQRDHNEPESGADGLTVDSAGRLYATSKVGLQMFDPTGRLGGVILKPQNAWLSNVVFGGPKFDILYVTCKDKVYKRKTKVTGVRYLPLGEAKKS